MPRHTLIPPFDKFRGTVSISQGGSKQILYDDPHRGNVARNCTKTPNPKTPAQISQRTRIALCAQAWKALTQSQANAWRALAAQINRTNSLGFRYTLTGINVFYAINTYRQMDGLAIIPDAPTTYLTPPILVTTPTLYIAMGIFHATTATNDGIHNNRALLRCTPSNTSQSRQRRKCELRVPTTDPALSLIPGAAGNFLWSITPDTITLTQGEYCGIEIVLMTNEYVPRSPAFFPLLLIH